MKLSKIATIVIIATVVNSLTGCALMYEPILPRFGNPEVSTSCDSCGIPIMPINSYRSNVVIVRTK